MKSIEKGSAVGEVGGFDFDVWGEGVAAAGGAGNGGYFVLDGLEEGGDEVMPEITGCLE